MLAYIWFGIILVFNFSVVKLLVHIYFTLFKLY